jgi:hypothetical protein
MPAEAVQGIAHTQETAKDTVIRCHLLSYGWIYLIFGALTALALYVMFTFPQGDI